MQVKIFLQASNPNCYIVYTKLFFIPCVSFLYWSIKIKNSDFYNKTNKILKNNQVFLSFKHNQNNLNKLIK